MAFLSDAVVPTLMTKGMLHLHTLVVKLNDPVYGSSKYYLQSRLCNTRPNNRGLLALKGFDS